MSVKSRNVTAWIILTTCISAYLAVSVIQGRFVTTDDVFFKSAGRHWARTGSFSAPEVSGFSLAGPPLTEIYFAQPPGYSFAFGLYTSVVGFGPDQCVLYDALIHILLAILTGATAIIVMGLPFRWAAAVAVLILPLGHLARPDELAMCVGLAGGLVWFSGGSVNKRTLLSGGIYGVCAATSAGVALMMTMAISGVALRVAGSPKEKLRVASLWTCAALMTLAACLAPILLRHPTAWLQFTSHAVSQSDILRLTVRSKPKDVNTPPDLKYFLLHSPENVLLIVGCLILTLLTFWSELQSRREFGKFWWGALSSIVFLLVFLPNRLTYWWFVGPWLMCSTALALYSTRQSTRPSTRVGVSLIAAAFYIVIASPYFKERLTIASLPLGQRFHDSIENVRNAIPVGASVMTNDYWWALADQCSVFDPAFARPDPSAIQYVVLTGNGSGQAGKPQSLPAPYQGELTKFTVVRDYLNREPTHLFLFNLHSAWGFGPLILARQPGTAK